MVNNVGQFNLTINDSDTIGFVVACLFSSAIDAKELREWAEYTIRQLDADDIPDYIYELMEFDGPLAGVYKTVGFAPVWNRTEDEEKAIYGITVKRGRDTYDSPVSGDEALKYLVQNPHIADTFNAIFPFIRV